MFRRTRRDFPYLVPSSSGPSAHNKTQIDASVHIAQFEATTQGAEIAYLSERRVPFEMTQAIGSLVSFHRNSQNIETPLEEMS